MSGQKRRETNTRPSTGGRTTRASATTSSSIKGQPTLDDKFTKKVVFSDVQKEAEKESKKAKEKVEKSKVEELKEWVIGKVREIRHEKLELEKVKLEVNAVIKELGERLEKLEEKIKAREEREKEREERMSVKSGVSGQSGLSFAGVSEDGGTGSVWTFKSGRTGVSAISGVSLSGSEVTKMKRLVYEKNRLERKNNIVIRGVVAEEGDLTKWVGDWILKNLEVNAVVEHARKSGLVIIAKVKEEDKKEIMKGKSKLKGTRIYIENDLNIDDRRKQEEIHRWVKEKRVQWWEVKSGTGRLFFKNVWRKWEDREVIEVEMKRSRKQDAGRKEMMGG